MVTLTSKYRGATPIAFAGASVTAAIRQVTNPAKVSLIRRSLGLENADAILEARLVTPRRKPTQLKAGAKATFTWAGLSGVVTLEPYADAIPPEWRDRYGERLILSFATDET